MGSICEEVVLQLFRTRHFQIVRIALHFDGRDLKESELRANHSADQTLPDTERRFTPNFMKELLEDYSSRSGPRKWLSCFRDEKLHWFPIDLWILFDKSSCLLFTRSL